MKLMSLLAILLSASASFANHGTFKPIYEINCHFANNPTWQNRGIENKNILLSPLLPNGLRNVRIGSLGQIHPNACVEDFGKKSIFCEFQTTAGKYQVWLSTQVVDVYHGIQTTLHNGRAHMQINGVLSSGQCDQTFQNY